MITHSFPEGFTEDPEEDQNKTSPITEETNILPAKDINLLMFEVNNPKIKLFRNNLEHW